MASNKENLPPKLLTPPVSRNSPSNKPALSRQRDHSACRVSDSPLKVKKTRENLKQASLYTDVPPPCVHGPHICYDDRYCDGPGKTPANNPPQPLSLSNNGNNITHVHSQALSEQSSQTFLSPQAKVQRQKSVSRRMLTRVKEGIASRSKSSQSIRQPGSETSLARRLSGRRKQISEAERRSQSFELSRDSIESTIEEDSGVTVDTAPPVQRSFTDSTVSTAEILDDLASVQVPSLQTSCISNSIEGDLEASQNSSSPPPPSSPSPQPTPRPLRKSNTPTHLRGDDKVALPIPCVDLEVTGDLTSVDVNLKRDVWIAIVATVRVKTTKISTRQFNAENSYSTEARDSSHNEQTSPTCNSTTAKHSFGDITNLRLCYKPAENCRIRNIIGQKSYKDLTIGQKCTLFIKIGVPKMHVAGNDTDPDQDCIFAELESMMGTLETDVLHVEARYRHSMLPSDNVVALKHTCKVLRPKTESRWSIIGFYEKEDQSSDVRARLAQYLADHYAADEALELLHRYFDFDTRATSGMAEIVAMLQERLNVQRVGLEDGQPEVVVTDIDMNARPTHEHFDTAPTTPMESFTPKSPPTVTHKRVGSSGSQMVSKLAPPIISAPKTTTSLTTSALASSSPQGNDILESQDSARQVWRHIRRTSLSARQLEEMTPDRLSTLEAGDDSLKELRRRAIANKRSVGAETLRAWKWDHDVQAKESPAEAPWM